MSTTKETLKRAKSKLSGLKRSRKFIPWRESSKFAQELEALLQDIKAGVKDSRTGAEMVASFFETDHGTLAHCDDSSGHVGDVYRFTAKDLFVEYAARCEDKDWLGELVLNLNRKDDYGVRDTLIDCARDYLPEPHIRIMIARLKELADAETEEYQKRHWVLRIESLARQIKDAPLFKEIRLATWGKPSTAACVDIARVYLESGDAETALSWLERVPMDETFQAHERAQLLLQIYALLYHSKREAYDHYLPKFLYPFNSMNCKNLVPACHHCNSTYKSSQDPAYAPKDPTQAATRRKVFYPYTINGYHIDIKIELMKADVAHLVPNDIAIEFGPAALREELETWKDVYGIEERYKAKCCCESDGRYWLTQVLDEWQEDGRSPDAYLKTLTRKTDKSPFTDSNFLKKAFLEGCDRAGLFSQNRGVTG